MKSPLHQVLGEGGWGVRHSSSSSIMQRLLPSSRMASLDFIFLLFLLIRNGERMLGEECGGGGAR